MKVFAFRPSNEFIGKFDIESIDALDSGFAIFANEVQVTKYDDIERDNRI
jgi:hypothetical protein|tara:strand:+ start:7740 stop:7889 length:150 start_codon:yes stop_codon:yes gene_type:complete